MPRSKDRSRSELEKLRGMSFKDKIWYIWNYYNYHIIGAIIVIAIIISFISASRAPGTDLYAAWITPHIEYYDLDTFTETIDDRLFGDDPDKIAEVSRFFTVSDDPQIMMQHYDRLIAMLSAGAIDIFIVDYQTLREYSLLEYIMPLDNILAEIRNSYSDIYDDIADNIITLHYGLENEELTEEKTGINISGSPLLQSFETPLREDAYLCVAISSNNLYNVVLVITEIFK